MVSSILGLHSNPFFFFRAWFTSQLTNWFLYACHHPLTDRIDQDQTARKRPWFSLEFILSDRKIFFLKCQNLHLRNPIPKRQILDSSKIKEFADDNFKFDENGRKFWNGQNTLWEIKKLLVTSYFALSQGVFHKTCAADT